MNKLAAALEGEGGGADWRGIGYVRIDGASDSRDRRSAVAKFRDDSNIHVALLSVTAAGTPVLLSHIALTASLAKKLEIQTGSPREDRPEGPLLC